MMLREEIFDKVQTDIAGMRVSNGYQLDYPNRMKGQAVISDCNNFPMLWYDLDEEIFNPTYEDNSVDKAELDLLIGCIIKNDSNNLISMREQCISDLMKFIRQDKSISGNNTLQLQGLLGLQEWYISNIKHETILSDGVSLIDVRVRIIYLDFYNDILNSQNINA